MSMKQEVLAKRAVYEYRPRDILAYVSLRLYLRNQCAMRDRWNRGIATELAVNQSQPRYNHILQFKEIHQNGCVEFRDLYIPGPNEILAEVALLAECSNNAGAFELPRGVYSYKLASRAETQGIFQYYFHGFRNRHRAIAQACRDQGDAVVLYTDIRKFYPSVTIDQAKNVWNAICKGSRLSDRFSLLGLKLLESYEQTTSSNPALLIGPMFSHLIGNLVLREIDLTMAQDAPGQYFRYVDDFVIVASKQKAIELEKSLGGMLNRIGLDLHRDKRMSVPSARWLEFQSVFEDDQSRVSWKTFIGGLKQLMLFRPDSRHEMEDRFREAGIRIRPLDYSEVVQNRDYTNKISSLLKSPWLRFRMQSLSPEQIISEGLQLRKRYEIQLGELLVQLQNSDQVGKKMRVPRLRFLLSRLGYLATTEQLKIIADAIGGVNEVAIFVSIYNALVERDVSELLKLGPKAVQSAVQPLKVASEPVRCSIPNSRKEVSQAYAVLQLNGVPLEVSNEIPDDTMTTFCRGGNEVGNLFESSNMYFRELACLYGTDNPELLSWCLDTAFDRDEDMAFDMLDYTYWAY